MLVLLIGHRRPHLGRHVSVLDLLSAIVPFLVRPDIVHEEGESGESTSGLSTHDGELGWSKVWSVLGLECLGPDDVTK